MGVVKRAVRRLRRRLGYRPPRKRLGGTRPPEPSEVSPELSERPDLAGRRAFLAEHILIQTHIPKTAGTAISTGLSSIVGGTHALDVRLRRSVPFDQLTEEDMADIHFLSGHFGFGVHRRLNRKPLYVAAVREPVSRVVSYYRYLQDHPDQPNSRFAIGRSFEEFWPDFDRANRDIMRDIQSRMLMGHMSNHHLDWEDVIDRVENDYFLIMPNPEVSATLRRLRAAFGVPWSKSPRINVSGGTKFKPPAEIRDAILAVNPLDARLYDYIEKTYPERLTRALGYIARHCLQPLEQDNQGTRPTS